MLHNLARKQDGEEVAFINIADARALTDLGLAERTQQGWTISEAGRKLLNGATASATVEAPSSVTPFTPKLV